VNRAALLEVKTSGNTFQGVGGVGAEPQLICDANAASCASALSALRAGA